MTVINNKQRNDLLDLIGAEIKLLRAKAATSADAHWAEAEEAVARKLGYGDARLRAEHLRNQIKGLQAELAELEGQMAERAQRPTVDQYMDAGVEVGTDQYGRVVGVPRIFEHNIQSVWDVEVLKHLNDTISYVKVWRQVTHLHHAIKREMLLAGTVEEARAVYQRFHQYVRQAVGDDLPELLADLEALPALRAPGEL